MATAAATQDPESQRLRALLDWWIELFTVVGQQDEAYTRIDFDAVLLESLSADNPWCGLPSRPLPWPGRHRRSHPRGVIHG